jgi:hypothetical protein
METQPIIYDCHTAERIKSFVFYERRGAPKVNQFYIINFHTDQLSSQN